MNTRLWTLRAPVTNVFEYYVWKRTFNLGTLNDGRRLNKEFINGSVEFMRQNFI